MIGGMLAGADSIDDLDLLRHGGMSRIFDGIRAPSTLGTYLRAFTHGHVQQLDAVSSRVLAGLTERVHGLPAPVLRGWRSSNAQLAVCSTPAGCTDDPRCPATGLDFLPNQALGGPTTFSLHRRA